MSVIPETGVKCGRHYLFTDDECVVVSIFILAYNSKYNFILFRSISMGLVSQKKKNCTLSIIIYILQH